MRPTLAPILSALLVLAPLSRAQVYEDPGPHAAGWRDVVLVLPGLDPAARIFYPATVAGEDAPADPSQGPYPLLGHVHGQSFTPGSYDQLHQHFASWGYVVCSIGPLAGGSHAPPAAAQKLADALHWMDAESDDPTSFLFDMVSDHPWTATGHSLGGAAMQEIVAIEPKVRAIVAMEPLYLPLSAAELEAFDGATLSIGASEDGPVPPAEHAYPFFVSATPLGRSVYTEIIGGSHYGSIDWDYTGGADPLSHDEQHRLHRKTMTAFLQAEIVGDENAYAAILGHGMDGEPIVRESGCQEPPLWALEHMSTPGTFVVGLGARPSERFALAWSPNPASIDTSFGLLGLDPGSTAIGAQGFLNAEGWIGAQQAIPVSASGTTIYVQGLVVHTDGAVLSESVAVVLP